MYDIFAVRSALAAWIAEKDYVALFAILISDFPVKGE
jgi:hypothetical protein